MSLPFTTNRFLPVNIKGDDNIVSDLNGNVSLLCNGKVALYGNTTLSEGKVLAIGKSPVSGTYPLDVSGNIQYSGNLYKAGVIQQDLQDDNNIQVLSASATVILNKNFVYHGINNNTITTIRLPNENTLTQGYRFVVFPMLNWSSLAATVTVNCESGEQILDVSAGVVSVQMTSNNPYVEFICIATTGTVRWATINRDPQRLLSGSNTFTGPNTFAGLQLQIDTSTNLLGNIIANGITVTPAMVSFLSLVRFSTSLNLVGIGAGANRFVSGSNNVAMGQSAHEFGKSNNNTAIGFQALRLHPGSLISNTAIGTQAGYSNGSNRCTYLGRDSGAGHITTAGNNCTFLGQSSGSSDASGNWTESTAIGYLSKITASNQVMLGRSTENVVCPGTLQVRNNYIATASPTIITGAANATLSSVLFSYYSVTSDASYSIILPAAAVGYLGCTIRFRRVGADPANAITSASANIFPVNSIDASNSLLNANVYQVTICCMVISATPTYGWVVVKG